MTTNFEIYCSCKVTNEERFDKLNESLQWVGCDNKTSCLSYQIRLKETGCEGGDWFHLECIDLNRLPQSRVLWFCNFCKSGKTVVPSKNSSILPAVPTRSRKENLDHSLKAEGRCIFNIVGDGNCLFRALSYFMYNSEKVHQKMRDTLSCKLLWLAKDDSLWVNCNEPKLDGPSGKSSSIHLLNKLSKFFKDEIMSHSKSHSFRESLQEYSKQMVKPVTGDENTEERLKKYGGSIALHTFSCVHGVNVWVLPTNQQKKVL